MTVCTVEYDDKTEYLYLPKEEISINKALIRYCGRNKCEDTITRLLREGLRFDPENYSALSVCIPYGLSSTGKLLMDKGMEFKKFQDWYGENNGSLADNEFCRELAAHWEQTHGQVQGEQADFGMNMA